MVRRVVAPPALPAFVGPGPADRAEHVAAEDPGADILEAARRKGVVGARRPFALAGRGMIPKSLLSTCHSLERARREDPFVQRFAADTQRIVGALVGARPESVERHGEATHAQF